MKRRHDQFDCMWSITWKCCVFINVTIIHFFLGLPRGARRLTAGGGANEVIGATSGSIDGWARCGATGNLWPLDADGSVSFSNDSWPILTSSWVMAGAMSRWLMDTVVGWLEVGTLVKTVSVGAWTGGTADTGAGVDAGVEAGASNCCKKLSSQVRGWEVDERAEALARTELAPKTSLL